MQEKSDMAAVTETRGYKIGEMSRETGVNIETIRYYEKRCMG